MTRDAKKLHQEFLERRRFAERMEAIPYIASRHAGLDADAVRAALATGEAADLVVHIQRTGGGGAQRSVHPANAPRPPGVTVAALERVLDGFNYQRDGMRANRLAQVDQQRALEAFSQGRSSGNPQAETADQRQRRRVRDQVFDDLKQLRGIRDVGLPAVHPPTPSANGKVSTAHMQRYAEERAAQDALLDLESDRLRALHAQTLERAAKEAPLFAVTQLGHVLEHLPREQRRMVERVLLTGTPEEQSQLYLVSRPIVGPTGQNTVGFSARAFDANSGGRPTPASLQRQFGLAAPHGIRVSSLGEILGDARERLTERMIYGDSAVADLPQHQRGLFVAPAPMPTGHQPGEVVDVA